LIENISRPITVAAIVTNFLAHNNALNHVTLLA